MQNVIYTVNEACELLRISRSTLQRRFEDGTIKKITYGRRVFASATSVHNVLQMNVNDTET